MEEEPDLNQWRLSQDLIGATQLSHQILHPTKKQSNLWRAGTDKLKTLLVDGTKPVNQLTKLLESATSQEVGVRSGAWNDQNNGGNNDDFGRGSPARS